MIPIYGIFDIIIYHMNWNINILNAYDLIN